MDGRACNGVLVSNQWVLTAASCFPENPTGGAPTKAASAVFYKETVKIVNLVIRSDRDLALAKLEVPVGQVPPMALATTTPVVGEGVRADGYGRTATEWVPDNGENASFTVSGVSPTTVSTAAVNGHDTCKGWAGGPLVRQVGVNLELVGIHSTSWQHGCLGETETRSGSTATRTDDIADWIRQNTPRVPDPDLAIQKPVTASSSYEADGWSAKNLVDGSSSTAWSSDSSLDKNHTESLTVDLAGALNVRKLVLYPRGDGSNVGTGFPVDFTVDTTLDDPTSPDARWTKIFTEAGFPKPTSAAPLEFSLATSFGGASAGALRITGTNLSTDPNGQYRMQLAEVAVYGANTTTGKPVTTSSTQEVPSSGWSANYAVDGVRSANGTGRDGWTSGGGPADRSEWIEVSDIGGFPMTSIDLYPRADVPDGSVGFPSTFTVEGSTDGGKTWTQLANGSGMPIASAGGARRLTFPATNFSAVKVTGSGFKADQFGNYYMQLGEVEVR
ncbi:discoidin domain-containing protein [Kutzneria kofuensis]|uniref:F5/8 type C domain-containing protein n=1 Tax=Kutzneria kofuensis TaxID=103725 RepID=A0A7W9KDU6_9PSEU|nr:discoidin domain-containing protein [Kutzneria kofuensis]MBB5890741.1 hypothetical protein [Kutzneria kofuensis]